jgi:hypothetical protein
LARHAAPAARGKNSAAPAVKREAKEDWSRLIRRIRRNQNEAKMLNHFNRWNRVPLLGPFSVKSGRYDENSATVCRAVIRLRCSYKRPCGVRGTSSKAASGPSSAD